MRNASDFEVVARAAVVRLRQMPLWGIDLRWRKTLFLTVLQGGQDPLPCNRRRLELVELMSRGCHTGHPEYDP